MKLLEVASLIEDYKILTILPDIYQSSILGKLKKRK